jgi:hypothetical protein
MSNDRSKLDNIPGYEPPKDYVYSNKKEGVYRTGTKRKGPVITTTSAKRYYTQSTLAEGVEQDSAEYDLQDFERPSS